MTSEFFTDGLILILLLGIYRLFEFGFEFNEIFAIFDWFSAIIYSRESILPILFTTASCDSPHHFSGESLFVRIICINSRLSFNGTVSRYSLYLVYYGEYLLPVSFIAESHCYQRRVIFNNIEGLPYSLKGQWSKKWTIHVEYCSPRTF
jgi:hypothetical protein